MYFRKITRLAQGSNYFYCDPASDSRIQIDRQVLNFTGRDSYGFAAISDAIPKGGRPSSILSFCPEKRAFKILTVRHLIKWYFCCLTFRNSKKKIIERKNVQSHSFMRKVNTSILFLFFVTLATAQVDIDDIFIESSPSLCSPGVVNRSPGKGAALTYSFNGDYKIRPPHAENPSKVKRDERFDAQLKIPISRSPRFKFLLGFQYTMERYHFDKIIPENYPLFKRLNEATLRNTSVNAQAVFPINNKYYTSFRLSANWQGDYQSVATLDNRFAVYRLTGIFGVKKRDDLEYGFGLMVNKGFRNNSAMPFGFYNRSFDEHWGIEAILPASVKARYNFSEKSMLLMGTEFSSQTYAMAVYEPTTNPFFVNGVAKAPYHYHRASLDAVATYYRQLTEWSWIQVKCGYSFKLKSQARDLPEKITYDLKSSNNVLGMVSLFLSPPKKYRL